MRLQAELTEKAAELATAQEQHAASDADWESRMKDAVSSAEQWKEFAEKLGAEKESLQSTLVATEQTLAVRCFSALSQCSRIRLVLQIQSRSLSTCILPERHMCLSVGFY